MTSTDSTIDDLPNEVLVPILQQIPQKDRNSACGVSLRWRAVMDETVGRKLFVGKPCPFTPSDEERNAHKYVSIDKIEELGVHVCHVGEVIDPLENNSLIFSFWNKIKGLFFVAESPSFKHPYLVRRVFFDGPIPSRYFESMIFPLCNLSRLDIHHSAISCLEHRVVQYLPLPRLQTLNIWGQNAHQGLAAIRDHNLAIRVQENLQLLLENNHFESMKNFAIEYPFDIPQDTLLTKGILKFLRSHCNTLVRLKIEVDVFVITEDMTESPSDRELYENSRKTSKWMSKLNNVELTVTSLFSVHHLQVWVQFVKQQKSLEQFYLLALRVPTDFILHVCSNNARTLQSLWISRLLLIHNNEVTLFNCNVFQMCTKLESLILESIIVIINTALLRGTSQLPKSLRVIEFTGMTISSDDVSVIAFEMPSLEVLLLSDIGMDRDLGMRLEDLKEVIRRRQLKSFQLCDGLNGRFPLKGISNCHPIHPVYLKPTAPGFFEWRQDEEGYFIPEEEPLNSLRIRNPTF